MGLGRETRQARSDVPLDSLSLGAELHVIPLGPTYLDN